MVAHRKKIVLTRDETTAALAGGKAAGAYLEQMGRTDLGQLSHRTCRNSGGMRPHQSCQRAMYDQRPASKWPGTFSPGFAGMAW